MDDGDFGSLALQIERHWREHRPKMSKALEQAGQLRESVQAAAQLTSAALHELNVVQRVPYNQAWELVREEWALLPSEQDRPNLEFDPSALPALAASLTPSGQPPGTSASPSPSASVRALRGRRPEPT